MINQDIQFFFHQINSKTRNEMKVCQEEEKKDGGRKHDTPTFFKQIRKGQETLRHSRHGLLFGSSSSSIHKKEEDFLAKNKPSQDLLILLGTPSLSQVPFPTPSLSPLSNYILRRAQDKKRDRKTSMGRRRNTTRKRSTLCCFLSL